MALDASELTGLGSVPTAAGADDQGGGGSFPGFDPAAPPAVEPASHPGSSPLAARGDHTHKGVEDVQSGDSRIGVATASAIKTITQDIIANWALAGVRVY